MGCVATAAGEAGPNYVAGAPRRAAVGAGYTLTGTVLEAGSCQAAADALVEFWLAGPDGTYGDAYRASVLTDAAGRFSFESDPPPAYSGQSPHIHLRISAPGYHAVFLLHYPAAGASEGEVAAVLAPE